MKTTEKKINSRALISIATFIILVFLVVSAMMIRVLSENPYTFGMFFWKGIHNFTGFLFMIFSILHLVKNWGAMKSYFRAKGAIINKEVIFGIILTILIIAIGLIFSYSFFIIKL